MIKTTDLDKIKHIAKLFLEMPLEPNKEFGWNIVHHPIISNCYQMYREEGKDIPIMLDVRKEDELNKLKKMIIESIDKVTNVGTFIQIINKPYLGTFFKFIKDDLNEYDYTMMLRILWTTMEFPNHDANVSRREFISYWKKVNLDYIYDEEDRKVVNSLPNEFIVYRGLMHNASKDALSWTLDLDKAIWFAKRFNNHGKVYKALARKEDILVYLSDRNESEIVIDYKKLRNVEEVKYE